KADKNVCPTRWVRQLLFFWFGSALFDEELFAGPEIRPHARQKADQGEGRIGQQHAVQWQTRSRESLRVAEQIGQRNPHGGERRQASRMTPAIRPAPAEQTESQHA